MNTIPLPSGNELGFVPSIRVVESLRRFRNPLRKPPSAKTPLGFRAQLFFVLVKDSLHLILQRQFPLFRVDFFQLLDIGKVGFT
jgi:hypothetical protein